MTNPTILPEHAKLKSPTVRGVVFEMAFVGERSASEALDHVKDELKTDFPKAAERLVHDIQVIESEDGSQPEIQVAKSAPPPNEPQFKLYSEEHNNEFAFGDNFLQFSYLESYSGWRDFLYLLKKIIDVYLRGAEINGYTYLKLIYMNRVDWKNGKEEKILQGWALPSIPPIPDLVDVFMRQQKVVVELPNGHQEIVVTAPGIDEDNLRKLVIQFDITQTIDFSTPQSANLESVMDWVDSAHERIYQTFHSMITPDFLEEIS